MEKTEYYFDRGVLHPGHPPIFDFAKVTANRDIKAGTILKRAADETYSVAGANDTPAGILLDDLKSGSQDIVRIVRHGMVVKSRLINASGANDSEPTTAMLNKLPPEGIYLAQAGWADSNFY
ncbi:MAG: hypothetical protein IJP90_10690 [Treponema sp.]|nr:hypothetical protein [Treponema sp.]